MCKYCFNEEIERFESQIDFVKFELILQKRYSENIIKSVDKINDDHSDFFINYPTYTCCYCGENWVLSVPDNAWRGYFLTLSNAIDLNEFNKIQDKKRRNGCIVVLALLFVVLLYYLIK